MSRAPRPDPDSLRAHCAAELRRLRAKADLSQAQLAAALGCTPQWIHQLEADEASISPQTAQDLDVYFKTDGHDTDDGMFTRLHRSIKKANLSRVLLPGFDAYLKFENTASGINYFTMHAMPGLLQTEEYARGTMGPNELPDTLEARVAGRMERKKTLTKKNPPSMLCLIEEAVFHRPVGGPQVMARQIESLIAAAESPRLQIHVLPFAPCAPAALDGSFILLSFPEDDDLVYTEIARVGQLIRKRDIVAERRASFNALMGEALSQAASLAWMKTKREEHL